ncbi:helix-turn-helix transcriptional regulator [Haloactinopolyspora sp.]|uniref:helix-turn-helix domain-containing protein n=1 Tax=Haloactinopolyspora sp. TaxID=1966353 RepID=UPI002604BFA0|nr:helix-turn-helix transcriptional regulator [Haloactinopolyspora sp.]
MDAGGLIKRARVAAGLSQRMLAERAGVSRHALSRYERASRVPSIRTLTTILAAAGWQVRAELEQLDADVRAAIARVAAEPLADRITVSRWLTFTELADLAYRVEGAAAANLLGAPIPVDHYDLAVADTDETVEVLARLATVHRYVIEAGRRRGARFYAARSTPDQSAARRLRDWFRAHCPDGTFWLRSGFSEARTRFAAPDDVARYVDVSTPHGPVRVAPLNEIEGADDHARRVLHVLREMTHESGDGVETDTVPGTGS